MAAEPKINSQSVGDVTVIYFTAKRMILDEGNIRAVAEELMRIAEANYKPKLILDLGAVQYLSSAVLGKLVAFYKAVQNNKGQLKLCGVQPAILKIFKITKLDKMFPMFPTQDAAVKAFKAGR